MRGRILLAELPSSEKFPCQITYLWAFGRQLSARVDWKEEVKAKRLQGRQTGVFTQVWVRIGCGKVSPSVR